MIREAIAKAADGGDLSEQEMQGAMQEIFSGNATPAQIGALLIALRIKGETLDEISGAAKVMLDNAKPVKCLANRNGQVLVDVVGTGGDGAGTFNVSTTAAFVVAGAGVKIAKHGNRAVSSSCGSADLIESLGVPLDLGPEEIGQCIDQVGIGFLFAPMLHQAMKHAIGPRREIGLRTIFNLLGPLTNPAGATALVVGVYDEGLTTPLAEVLGRLGVRRAMVVHGLGGYDEISITGPTRISSLQNGEVSEMVISPEDCGLSCASHEDIIGGNPDQCRAHTLAVLRGEPGPKRDMVLINSAAAMMVAGKADDLAEGVLLAAESIDSGRATAKVKGLVEFSGGLAAQRKSA